MDDAAAASYKQLKEAFVSGLTGGSSHEIVLVLAIPPTAVLVWNALQGHNQFFTPYSPLAFVVDVLLNAAAILLATTVRSPDPIKIPMALLTAALVYTRTRPALRPPSKKPKPPSSSSSSSLSPIPPKPFVTLYRGSMMVMTCVAILAVDFPVFPRRFAKVETWGTSLMDLGVGSFVFSAGLVGARPIVMAREQRARGLGAARPSLPRRMVGALRRSLPLLVLGVVRLLTVKGLDYAEHVSEYGVHWNFFFTLACLPPFVTLTQPPLLRLVRRPAVLALGLGALYQLLLSKTPLQAFVLGAQRLDFLSKNREGVSSLAGYLPIYLAGQDAGILALPRARAADGGVETSAAKTVFLWRLVSTAALWTSLYLVATTRLCGLGLDLTVSRRLANLPYVLWIAAFNTTLLALFYVLDPTGFWAQSTSIGASAGEGLSDKQAHDRATSRVLRGFNRNGLAVFLLANLLTGLVNMTVPTLYASVPLSMGILTGYMFVLSGVAVLLDHFDVSIKL